VGAAPEVMHATDFEYRHQTLLHLLVVGLGVSTYFLSPDDIVWALVRHHSNSAFLEQVAFGVGTLVLLGCAVLETWARAYPQPVILLLSRLLFALVVGLLVPLSGTIILIVGEALLVFRLFVRGQEAASVDRSRPHGSAVPRWGEAFRQAVSKWGLAATMILFTLTLKDTVAEIGASISLVVWLALNFSRLIQSPDSC
jgi:hypothetical protein